MDEAVMPMMMKMLQQQNAALQMIAQAMAMMAHIQTAPRTAKKNPDGTMSMMIGASLQ